MIRGLFLNGYSCHIESVWEENLLKDREGHIKLHQYSYLMLLLSQIFSFSHLNNICCYITLYEGIEEYEALQLDVWF